MSKSDGLIRKAISINYSQMGHDLHANNTPCPPPFFFLLSSHSLLVVAHFVSPTGRGCRVLVLGVHVRRYRNLQVMQTHSFNLISPQSLPYHAALFQFVPSGSECTNRHASPVQSHQMGPEKVRSKNRVIRSCIHFGRACLNSLTQTGSRSQSRTRLSFGRMPMRDRVSWTLCSHAIGWRVWDLSLLAYAK